MNVIGGQLIQSNGNPVWPGTHVTGPLLAGNIKDSSGLGLAGLGSQNLGALANVGYARMSQAGRILEQSSGGGYASPDLIIPAQSLILSMTLVGLVAFANPTVIGIVGSSGFFMSAAMPAPTLGYETIAPPTTQPQIGNWLNVGNTDVQINALAAANANGVAILIIDYLQGINAATS